MPDALTAAEYRAAHRASTPAKPATKLAAPRNAPDRPNTPPAPNEALTGPETPPPPTARFHVSTATAPRLTPGTVDVRLAAVPVAEWEVVRAWLLARGWKSY